MELSNIDHSTIAFALDPGRIYLNLKDKYPQGGVIPQDRERILGELIELFNSLKLENQRIVKKVYLGEKIYRGPYKNNAPDLILMGEKGFNIKASLRSEKIIDKGIFTGKHSQENAFLLLKGDRYIPNITSPTVSDCLRIIGLSN